jgi:cytidylate kinase
MARKEVIPMSLPRSIERIVEDQSRRWAFGGRGASDVPPGPLITISRQHGAGGREVARRVAERLGLDFFDRQIIGRIAESAHLSELVVRTLDERARKTLTDWLAGFMSEGHMSPGTYHEHLMRVIGTIAAHGNAVILGRGAHLILGRGRALRVLVVAPLAARLLEVGRRQGLSERDARSLILRVDAERRGFLAQHFHTDERDITAFDLVANTEALGVEGAVNAVCTAVAAMTSDSLPARLYEPGQLIGTER